MSLHVLVFNEIEDYRKVLLLLFFVQIAIFCNFVVFCIVCYVIATSSWIFTLNVEKCDFKYLF